MKNNIYKFKVCANERAYIKFKECVLTIDKTHLSCIFVCACTYDKIRLKTIN
jgi:hypothetical protein